MLSKQLVINISLQSFNFLLFVPGAFKKLLLYLQLRFVKFLLLIVQLRHDPNVALVFIRLLLLFPLVPLGVRAHLVDDIPAISVCLLVAQGNFLGLFGAFGSWERGFDGHLVNTVLIIAPGLPHCNLIR
jgi:hypothetical protein